MVTCRHSLVEIVGEDEVGIVQGKCSALCPSHEPDAPIVIARKMVAEVIKRSTGEVGAGVETLVADKHSPLETVRGELLGCR